MRLVRTERIPSRCGVMVRAKVDGELRSRKSVMVEPELDVVGDGKLQMEEMIVRPDAGGYVSVLVTDFSCQSQSIRAGETIGQASLSL